MVSLLLIQRCGVSSFREGNDGFQDVLFVIHGLVERLPDLLEGEGVRDQVLRGQLALGDRVDDLGILVAVAPDGGELRLPQRQVPENFLRG